MIETRLSEIEERNIDNEGHLWTILHRKSDIPKLVKALREALGGLESCSNFSNVFAVKCRIMIVKQKIERILSAEGEG